MRPDCCGDASLPMLLHSPKELHEFSMIRFGQAPSSS